MTSAAQPSGQPPGGDVGTQNENTGSTPEHQGGEGSGHQQESSSETEDTESEDDSEGGVNLHDFSPDDTSEDSRELGTVFSDHDTTSSISDTSFTSYQDAISDTRSYQDSMPDNVQEDPDDPEDLASIGDTSIDQSIASYQGSIPDNVQEDPDDPEHLARTAVDLFEDQRGDPGEDQEGSAIQDTPPSRPENTVSLESLDEDGGVSPP